MAEPTPLKRTWSVLWKILLFLVLFGYLIVVVFPLLWLFYTSLKDDRAIFMSPVFASRLPSSAMGEFSAGLGRCAFLPLLFQ